MRNQTLNLFLSFLFFSSSSQQWFVGSPRCLYSKHSSFHCCCCFAFSLYNLGVLGDENIPTSINYPRCLLFSFCSLLIAFLLFCKNSNQATAATGLSLREAGGALHLVLIPITAPHLGCPHPTCRNQQDSNFWHFFLAIQSKHHFATQADVWNLGKGGLFPFALRDCNYDTHGFNKLLSFTWERQRAAVRNAYALE